MIGKLFRILLLLILLHNSQIKDCLREYEEEKAIIEKSLQIGNERIDGIDIKRYYNELIKLPLTGKKIEELFDRDSQAQASQVEVKNV